MRVPLYNYCFLNPPPPPHPQNVIAATLPQIIFLLLPHLKSISSCSQDIQATNIATLLCSKGAHNTVPWTPRHFQFALLCCITKLKGCVALDESVAAPVTLHISLNPRVLHTWIECKFLKIRRLIFHIGGPN